MSRSQEVGKDSRVRFGAFVLDRRRGLLLGDTGPVGLRAKAWDVLSYLVERPGALVSVAEFGRALWPEVTVAAKTIHNTIAEVRHALGDLAEPRSYIETVTSRGYRWIAPVAPADGDDTEPAARIGGAAGEPHWVDRPVELTQLRLAWMECRDRGVRLVLVEGEPGIGKTTLLRMFLERIGTEASLRAARGHCLDARDCREPFGPVLQAFRQLTDDLGRDHLAEVMRAHARTWLLQCPWLVEAEELARLRAECLGATAGRALREAASAFEEIAKSGATVVLFEDLQWADAPTLRLLALLADQARNVPLLVLGSYRAADLGLDTGVAAGMAAVRRRVHHQVNVQPFSVAQVAGFLDHRFGADLSARLVEPLHRQSLGNPLVLSSLSEQLIHTGALVRSGDRWTLHADALEVDVQLPEELHAVIAPQVDRLQPQALQILEIASAAGMEFSSTAVAAVMGGPESKVHDELQHLAIAGAFVRRVNGSASPPQARFTFINPVHQRLLYDRIPANRRARVHLELASFLRDHPDEVAFPAEIASHFRRAGRLMDAAEYLERAAMAAAQRCAYEEACGFVGAAMAEVQRLPDFPEAGLRLASLQLWLANLTALRFGNFAAESGRAFRRAETLLEDLDQPLLLFRARLGRLAHAFMRSRCADAHQISAAQMAAAANTDIVGLPAAAYCYNGIVRLSAGDLHGARDDLRHGLSLEISPELPRFGDLRALGEIFAAYAETILGHEDEARILSQRALERTRRHDMRFQHASALVFAAQAAVWRGDIEAAARWAAESLSLGRDYNLGGFEPLSDFFVQWAATTRDSNQLQAMTAALARAKAAGLTWMRSHHLVLLAERCLEAGDIDSAVRHGHEAREHLHTSGERLCAAELHRVSAACIIARTRSGRLSRASAEKDYAQARQRLERAVSTAQAQGARLFENRARRALEALEQV